jgi:hypothetical protein
MTANTFSSQMSQKKMDNLVIKQNTGIAKSNSIFSKAIELELVNQIKLKNIRK